MATKQQATARFNEVMAKARTMYNLPELDVALLFDLRGRAAGQARWRRVGLKGRVYQVRLNAAALTIDGGAHLLDETIPHEIAHVLCWALNLPERGHGVHWRRVARSLGCSANRCHSLPLESARKTKQYVYVASCGASVPVSAVIHGKIQKGQTRILARTGGRIAAENYQGPAQ